MALKRSPEELKKRQAERRSELQKQRQTLELAQREECMALHVGQKRERDKPFARAARAVLSMIASVLVLRAVLMPLMKKSSLRIEEQHRAENDALDRRYARETEALDSEGKNQIGGAADTQDAADA